MTSSSDCPTAINHHGFGNASFKFNNSGIEKFHSGDLDGALEDYNQAIKINPNYVDAYNNRGCLLVEEGDYERAIKDFAHAIKINPYHATAYFNRGSAWRGLKEYKNAIEDFKRAMELDPTKKEKASAEIKFCESRIKDLSM